MTSSPRISAVPPTCYPFAPFRKLQQALAENPYRTFPTIFHEKNKPPSCQSCIGIQSAACSSGGINPTFHPLLSSPASASVSVQIALSNLRRRAADTSSHPPRDILHPHSSSPRSSFEVLPHIHYSPSIPNLKAHPVTGIPTSILNIKETRYPHLSDVIQSAKWRRTWTAVTSVTATKTIINPSLTKNPRAKHYTA